MGPAPAFLDSSRSPLEEWQSRHAYGAESPIADAGLWPVTLREVVALGADLDPLIDLPLCRL